MHRARRDYRAFKATKTGIGTGPTGGFPDNTGAIQAIYRRGSAFSICIATSWCERASRTPHGEERRATTRLEPWAPGTALARGPSFRLRPSGYGGQVETRGHASRVYLTESLGRDRRFW